MTSIIPSLIASELNLKKTNVSTVFALLNEGATVPFIARYRKDETGGMEDVSIFEVQKKMVLLKSLEKRKQFIISVIEEQGNLTEELKSKLELCWDEKHLEDAYLPFKPKRQTKAEVARQNGLEVLAKIIMKQDRQDFQSSVNRFINSDVKTYDAAVEGAQCIMSEWMSENQAVRNRIRGLFYRKGELVTKVKKGKEKLGEKYEQYFSYCQQATKVPSHRFLAIQRAQEEGVLSASIKVDKKEALESISNFFIKGNGAASLVVSKALSEAYTRLIKPSIENEIWKEIKAKSDDIAIEVFAKNLKQLLMVKPLGSKRVLAIDPGFKSGCKVVCLNEQGNLMHNDNIYPHPPQKQIDKSIESIVRWVNKYKIEAIAIGNGTAGRETEDLVKAINFDHNVDVFVVNENGASIYSASVIGRAEFPSHDVTVRGAVSIGRRLMDPLAELVKIDAKSIGVGQYQHDVDQVKLKTELDHIVEVCVNQVGVNVNTASEYLLRYVAGVGKIVATNIIQARKENGAFTNRLALKKVPRLGDKVFEQCAGFLKIEGINPLDNTSVHPENYKDVDLIANALNKKVNDLIDQPEIEISLVNEDVINSIGKFTVKDIIKELSKPGFDPREKKKMCDFDPSLKSILDVREGMIVHGVVTNLTNFGAFIDIGIKENGLVHISHVIDRYISSPMEVLDLNDHVKVKVVSVDINKKRIGLSIKEAN
tara:strand:+ start:215 stop:2338 length:2124 start_codon:yes stop_codon:yes gene_type:complete